MKVTDTGKSEKETCHVGVQITKTFPITIRTVLALLLYVLKIQAAGVAETTVPFYHTGVFVNIFTVLLSYHSSSN